MGEITAIEWTDSTVNFWWGCTKVSPGCDNCYAEKWNDFRGNKQWGQWMPACEMSDEDEDRIYRSNRKARPDQCQGTMDEIYGRTCTVEEIVLHRDGSIKSDFPNGAMTMFKVGKKHSGRSLGGTTYTEFPRRAA